MSNTLITIAEALTLLANVYYTPVLLSEKTDVVVEQSPESQPTYDFVVPWAKDVTHTSVCIAAGALVVVLSGRMLRSGRKAASTTQHKPLKMLITFLSSIAAYFLIIQAFGAPLLHSHARTLSLAVLLSTYTALPVILQNGEVTLDGVLAQKTTIAATLACTWISIIPIGLDWDRPWQVYPLPLLAASSIGYVIGLMAALTGVV